MKSLRFVVYAAAIIALMMVAKRILDEKKRAYMEEQANLLLHQDQYHQAVDAYRELLSELPKGDSLRRDRAKYSLARCYVRLAESPGTGPLRSMEYYQRAAAYDPSVIRELDVEQIVEPEGLAPVPQP